MNNYKETQKKIEKNVAKGYKSIEEGVVSGYKTIENATVSGYKTIEKKFIDTFLGKAEEKQNYEKQGYKEDLLKPGRKEMNDTHKKYDAFVGYEYREVVADRNIEAMYTDGYENFGWELDGVSNSAIGPNKSSMKFKRDRKIRNKAELTRLQRQFDAGVSEVSSMEKSKNSKAFTVALATGLVGTAFMAGATFAYLAGIIVLCIVLAVPGFLGWGLAYFMYKSTYEKKSLEVTPMIESKYDEIYELCEKGNSLLA